MRLMDNESTSANPVDKERMVEMPKNNKNLFMLSSIFESRVLVSSPELADVA